MYDEKKMGEASRKAGANDQLREITKAAGRKGSDAAEIGDLLGNLMRKIAPFLDNPIGALGKNPIPVKVSGIF